MSHAPDSCLPEADLPRWQLPIDPAAYRRVLEFTPAMRDALADILAHQATGGHIRWRHLPRPLQPLVRPLLAVLDTFAYNQTSASVILSLLFCHMHQQQQSFWRWSTSTWLELLNADAQHPNYAEISSYRQGLFLVAYTLCVFPAADQVGRLDLFLLARRLFGPQRVEQAIERVQLVLRSWGYHAKKSRRVLPGVIIRCLVLNRSPYLEDLSLELLTRLRASHAPYQSHAFVQLSRVLAHLGIVSRPLEHGPNPRAAQAIPTALTGVPEEWAGWCQRWRATTTRSPHTTGREYYYLLKTGRWLAVHHPSITSPAQWTRELAVSFVAAVDKTQVGEYVHGTVAANTRGRPLAPRGKARWLKVVRAFFCELQEWGWIGRQFEPRRYLVVPRAVQALIGPNPRVIADDIWAKLLWAGLNLTLEDVPKNLRQPGTRVKEPWYPLELMQALALAWLFSGLRVNELCRLRVGCIRWQSADGGVAGANRGQEADVVCLLDVPVTKTSSAFTKPVDRVVGEAIERWEGCRPSQPVLLDPKTNEAVHLLFLYRGRRLGQAYLNHHLIPLLCRKAGVPEQDARGPITSHRARSTIATQLYNAKEPMTLFELQAWLGHRSPASTQHYAKVTPTKLTQAYQQADYFARNVRTIQVLIDQEAVRTGDAAKGLPWKYYDLGHGYCTYDFFEQCEHRMACAKCDFYRPKDTFLALLEEKQAHLLYMQQEIPLSELELAVVDGDLAATEQLIAQLQSRPTPAGSRERPAESSPERA
ncbi:MAG: tyrosine-type recombinase/integrase [Chloroflexi bacterium OHK40]